MMRYPNLFACESRGETFDGQQRPRNDTERCGLRLSIEEATGRSPTSATEHPPGAYTEIPRPPGHKVFWKNIISCPLGGTFRFLLERSTTRDPGHKGLGYSLSARWRLRSRFEIGS